MNKDAEAASSQTDLAAMERRARAYQAGSADLQSQRDKLRALVMELSQALTDEGPDWSEDEVDRLRRQVASALPLTMVPEWLRPYHQIIA